MPTKITMGVPFSDRIESFEVEEELDFVIRVLQDGSLQNSNIVLTKRDSRTSDKRIIVNMRYVIHAQQARIRI